jgi:hypothetical protein
MQGIPRRPFVHVDLPTPKAFSLTRETRPHVANLVLLGNLGDLQVCRVVPTSATTFSLGATVVRHTGRQALLQLLGLVGILEDKGVEVLLAADLELDVVGLLVLLDPRGYNCSSVRTCAVALGRRKGAPGEEGIIVGCGRAEENVQEASFLRQISMN